MAENKKQYLARDAKMPVPTTKSPVADWLPRNNEAYREIYSDVTSGNPFQGTLGALGLIDAPIEQFADYLSDNTFAATGSPALGTAAYIGPYAATMPIGMVRDVGKGVLKSGAEAIHNGMAYGEGPLAGLQHLAPGVMKREGGNWFPDRVHEAVGAITQPVNSRIPAEILPVIEKWQKGPFKNYIQKRFASPNDEIRKLYDEGLEIVPPYETADIHTNAFTPTDSVAEPTQL